MPTTPTIDQARESVLKTIKSSTALAALVGAGDLAYERLRALSTELADRASHLDTSSLKARKLDVDAKAFDPRSIDFTKLADDAKAFATKAQEVAQHYAAAFSEQAKDAPADAQAIPAKFQAALDDLVSSAMTMYAGLAKRGQAVVSETSTPSTPAASDTARKPVAKKVAVKKATSSSAKKTTSKASPTTSIGTRSTTKKPAVKKSTTKKA